MKVLRETPVTETEEDESSFYAPSFNHALKDPVERDINIPSTQRIVILEGNYLLLNDEPWKRIQDLVDET